MNHSIGILGTLCTSARNDKRDRYRRTHDAMLTVPGLNVYTLEMLSNVARLAFLLGGCLMAQDHSGWRDYGGASDTAQYSALTQINRSNVHKLEVAWTYSTGDNGKYFFNPIVIDATMYVLAKHDSIVALDAATGKELWAYASGPETKIITNRGINYWQSGDGSDRRLLFASNHFLRAIDARTGKPIVSFGDGGAGNLKDGLGRDPKNITLVQSLTPGRVLEDLLILG